MGHRPRLAVRVLDAAVAYEPPGSVVPAAPGGFGGLRESGSSAVPVVLVERGLELPVTLHEFACSHHAARARAAIEYLLGLGHSRIGYLERDSPHTAPQIRSGLTVALRGAGLDPDPVHTASLPRWTAPDAARFLDALLAAGATAALCFADREASLLVSAALRAGLRVPQDLSVIGYDDELADLSEVPLTAVSPAKAEIGRRAVDILRSRSPIRTAPGGRRCLCRGSSSATPPARHPGHRRARRSGRVIGTGACGGKGECAPSGLLPLPP